MSASLGSQQRLAMLLASRDYCASHDSCTRFAPLTPAGFFLARGIVVASLCRSVLTAKPTLSTLLFSSCAAPKIAASAAAACGGRQSLALGTQFGVGSFLALAAAEAAPEGELITTRSERQEQEPTEHNSFKECTDWRWLLTHVPVAARCFVLFP
jgi:hypothetical protein